MTDRRRGRPAVKFLAARAVAPFRGQESESLRASLIAGALGTMVVSLGAIVWNFVGILLLTRVLSPRGYGAYVYALAWATLLGVPALVGLPQLVVRQIAAAQASGAHGLARGMIRRAYQWAIVASLCVMTVGAIGAVFIGRGEPAVRRAYLLALLLIPAVALYEINESIMRGFRRVLQGRVAETTVQPLLLVGFVLAVRTLTTRHVGAGLAMALTVAAALGALVVSMVLVRRAVPDEVRAAEPVYEHRAWRRSAAPLFVQTGASAAHLQVSLVLVGALAGVSSSGVFNTALRWATFVSFVQVVLNFPVVPAIARLHASGERARLQLLLGRSARIATAAALPVAVGLVIFRHPALRVFGPEFARGGSALAILAVGELLGVACGSVTFAMAMTGHERSLAGTTVVAVVVNVVLGVALVPMLGVNGIAIARAVSVVGLNMALVWQLWRLEGVAAPVVGRRVLERLSPVRRG